jgi:hypothetical protein
MSTRKVGGFSESFRCFVRRKNVTVLAGPDMFFFSFSKERIHCTDIFNIFTLLAYQLIDLPQIFLFHNIIVVEFYKVKGQFHAPALLTPGKEPPVARKQRSVLPDLRTGCRLP